MAHEALLDSLQLFAIFCTLSSTAQLSTCELPPVVDTLEDSQDLTPPYYLHKYSPPRSPFSFNLEKGPAPSPTSLTPSYHDNSKFDQYYQSSETPHFSEEYYYDGEKTREDSSSSALLRFLTSPIKVTTNALRLPSILWRTLQQGSRRPPETFDLQVDSDSSTAGYGGRTRRRRRRRGRREKKKKRRGRGGRDSWSKRRRRPKRLKYYEEEGSEEDEDDYGPEDKVPIKVIYPDTPSAPHKVISNYNTQGVHKSEEKPEEEEVGPLNLRERLKSKYQKGSNRNAYYWNPFVTDKKLQGGGVVAYSKVYYGQNNFPKSIYDKLPKATPILTLGSPGIGSPAHSTSQQMKAYYYPTRTTEGRPFISPYSYQLDGSPEVNARQRPTSPTQGVYSTVMAEQPIRLVATSPYGYGLDGAPEVSNSPTSGTSSGATDFNPETDHHHQLYTDAGGEVPPVYLDDIIFMKPPKPYAPVTYSSPSLVPPSYLQESSSGIKISINSASPSEGSEKDERLGEEEEEEDQLYEQDQQNYIQFDKFNGQSASPDFVYGKWNPLVEKAG